MPIDLMTMKSAAERVLTHVMIAKDVMAAAPRT